MPKKSAALLPDNAYAKKALDAIAQIEQEAQNKKSEQLQTLREALETIDQRMKELAHQKEQIEEAIGKVTGKAAAAPKRGRKNHDEVRARVVRWLASHAGEKFASPDLQREFPELAEVPSVAAFLKKAMDAGQVQHERHGGPRTSKYFVTKV